MKRILTIFSLLAMLLLAASRASADGLIYQLPDDGTSITFDWKGSVERRGQTEAMSGTLQISSVGQETVDDQPCRWIEFKMTMNSEERRTINAKVLVPEADLVKGKSPIDHVHKAWVKRGDQAPQELTDFSTALAGPLPAFLAGPADDAQKQESVTVKSGLGEHKCDVTSGSTTFEQSGRQNKFTLTNYLQKDAPFGIVKTELRIEMERNGEAAGTVTMTLVAKEVGKNAKPEIPNGR